MYAKYVLAMLGVVFLTAGALRAARVGVSHPQSRTWLLIGTIFVTVSAWLFLRA